MIRTCITSIVRIRTLKTAASTKDPNWDNVDAATWSFLEVTLAIIAACLPTLRPLFSKLMPRIFGSSYGRSNGPSTSGQYAQSRNFQYLKDVPRTRTEDRPSGSMEDTTALREDVPLPPISHNFHGRTFTNISVGIPAPSQNFNEKVGSPRSPKLSTFSRATSPIPTKGGITATTVVTREVVSEMAGDNRSNNSKTSL